MIATKRGLYVLAVIAALLAVLLAIDLQRTRGPVDHALVPGFDEAAVTSIKWSAHPMGPYLGIERMNNGAPWRRTFPTAGEVEARVVADVLATLRGARWQRVRDVERPGPVMIEVGVRGGKTISISLGMNAPSDEQAWVTVDNRAYLVDAWIVRALTPASLDVAIRRPLVAIPGADSFSLGGGTISGHPRRYRRATDPVRSNEPPIGIVLDPSLVDELEKAIANLELAALSTRPLTPDPGGVRIAGAGTEAVLGGACNDDPQLVALVAPSGGGCVRAQDAAAITSIVERLRGAPSSIAATHVVPFAPRTITLPDGGVLDLAKRPRIGTTPANDTAVSELLAVLSLPGPVVRELTTDADVLDGPRMVVAGTKAALELRLDPTRHSVKRTGDGVVLELTKDAFAMLVRPARAYEEITLWNEDVSTIRRVTVSGQVFTRGDVLGEWSNANMPGDVDALAKLLANPIARGLAVSPPTSRAKDIVIVQVGDPTGAERTHQMVVETTVDECIAEVFPNRGGSPPGKVVTVRLDVAICRAIPRAR